MGKPVAAKVSRLICGQKAKVYAPIRKNVISMVAMYCKSSRLVQSKDNLGAPNVTSLLTEVAGPSAYGTCLGMADFEVIVWWFVGVSGPEALDLGSCSMILIKCPCRNGGKHQQVGEPWARLDLLCESGKNL